MSAAPTLPDAEALFGQMADAVYLLEPLTSRILWANCAGWTMLGLSAEEVLNHSVLSLQKDVVGAPQWVDIAGVIRTQSPYVFVGRHRHRDGHEVAVEVVTTQFLLGEQEYFLSVARDVTRRLALEHELHGREQQLWFALNEASDGLWDWDLGDDSVFFSPQLQRMLGYGPGEMPPVLSTWRSNLHPEDAPRVLRMLRDHLDGRRVRYEAEYRLRNRNGHYIWVHDHGRVSDRDGAGEPIRMVGMLQDITDRKVVQLSLESLAASDGLTGLPNRRHGEGFLAQQLEVCSRQGGSLGLCLLDLDHFKRINDLHGHLKGDEVLQWVAHTLGQVLRRSDLAFRWGGEEFVVVCPEADLAQTWQIGERIREALAAQPWERQLQVQAVTASVGLAVYPAHGHDALSLFAGADAALYRAKMTGRNRCEVARAEDLGAG
ncbi:MAG TPA: diguanylate cyclase [Burkholderiaceae bacterium]|nr:diguanylate cyclase [Burkholderiaceae bacterium]HMY99700.1 diguanylate cyclase [Burkholderiaceae bacterium]HNB44204.1 diguanylate cyclase [Burkholderiaceae bacterium]HNG79720.1 diguanylate cyclase [Burkholderiaceae bacterium]